jgi:hypothetical protein
MSPSAYVHTPYVVGVVVTARQKAADYSIYTVWVSTSRFFIDPCRGGTDGSGVPGPSDANLGPVTPLPSGGGYQAAELGGITWDGPGEKQFTLDKNIPQGDIKNFSTLIYCGEELTDGQTASL